MCPTLAHQEPAQLHHVRRLGSFSRVQPWAPHMQKSLDSLTGAQSYDPELLRAVSGRNLLQLFGHVFGSSDGDEATFRLSEPRGHMDFFISHSWQTAGWLKTVAIMFTLNTRRAILIAVAVQFIVLSVQIAGARTLLAPPIGGIYIFDGDVVRHVKGVGRAYGFVIASVACFVVLLFGQQLPGPFKTWFFLDKCCIHQTNQAKKQRGIKQLGVFLQRSEQLIVMWQPEYFKRLWCIYELAAFAFLHSGNLQQRIVILPLKLPVFVLALFFFHLAASLCFPVFAVLVTNSEWHAIWVVNTIPAPIQYFYYLGFSCVTMFGSLYLLPSFVFWTFAKAYMGDRRRLLQQLGEFRLACACCTVESDREFVVGQIGAWFGSPAQFEGVVRTELLAIAARHLRGQRPMPYAPAVLGSICHLFFLSSSLLPYLEDDPAGCFWRLLLLIPLLVCCADPIAINLVLLLAGTSFGEDVAGRSLLQRKLAGPLLSASIFSAVNGVSASILSPALPLSAAACVTCAGVAATGLFYRGLPRLEVSQEGALENPQACEAPQASSSPRTSAQSALAPQASSLPRSLAPEPPCASETPPARKAWPGADPEAG